MKTARPWIPKFTLSGPAPTLAQARRQDFAARVIGRLTSTERVAVIDEHGRPAMVACTERLFDLLAKDHPIVGVYREGATVPDVIDDLRAAGL